MGIYLDNAATSFPKPKEVATAVYDFMVNNGTSSGRGSYKKAMQSDYIVYECRKLIGKLFNFDNPKKVVLTSNVTDSLNIAMRGILKENDHVITSSLEHNAVWRCLKTLERDINIKIDTVECSKDGITNPQDIKKYIKKDTALIVFTQASNVLGTIQPIREIGAIAREHNIPFLVDSAQSAGAMKIDVKEDNIDILAFTGHKSLLGPMGTGGLIINTDIDIKPLKAGGTGGDSAYEYQPDYYPNHLETGTSNVSGIAGLREAIKFLNKEGIENIGTSLKRVKNANLNALLPEILNINLKEGLLLMNNKINGFTSNATLLGVESRSSAPIRFYRDENMESNIKGIYPIGEGAGYAGGIMSSAIDGLKCSEVLLKGER